MRQSATGRLRDMAAGRIAKRMEANRLRLTKTDPDAARILTSTFDTGAPWKASPELLGQMAAYADVKHRANRSDLYHRMFDGVSSTLTLWSQS